MGDVYCAKCGEPWDYYGARHGDMEPEEFERFMRGEGCPVCDFGQKCPYCGGEGRGDFECDECYGDGMVWDIEKDDWVECPKCKGYGYVEVCPKCGGTGKPRGGSVVEHFRSIMEGSDEDPLKWW